MKPQTYYAEQSFVTDPGEAVDRLAGLPGDPAALQRVARGLVLHYRADDPLPTASLRSGSRRSTPATPRRCSNGSSSSTTRQLTEERPPVKRLIGCCRDFTVLFLTMARQHGVPARARVGFATYFVSGFNVDHEVAEVWDAAEARWRLIDPELGDEHVDPNDGARVDPLDVPRDRFLIAGRAWQACRRGDADPETFLVDPGLEVPATRGWPQLRHNLVHDLTALNKVEMLLWDDWGLLLEEELSESDLRLLDRVAELTLAGDEAFARDPAASTKPRTRLRMPGAVTSHSPTTGTPSKVALKPA